uniref:Uncharacterized protein n=1 Tax=Macrostomum lignano TaxID=282301 RepID=A0A1I8F142_9PLAT
MRATSTPRTGTCLSTLLFDSSNGTLAKLWLASRSCSSSRPAAVTTLIEALKSPTAKTTPWTLCHQLALASAAALASAGRSECRSSRISSSSTRPRPATSAGGTATEAAGLGSS